MNKALILTQNLHLNTYHIKTQRNPRKNPRAPRRRTSVACLVEQDRGTHGRTPQLVRKELREENGRLRLLLVGRLGERERNLDGGRPSGSGRGGQGQRAPRPRSAHPERAQGGGAQRCRAGQHDRGRRRRGRRRGSPRARARSRAAACSRRPQLGVPAEQKRRGCGARARRARRVRVRGGARKAHERVECGAGEDGRQRRELAAGRAYAESHRGSQRTGEQRST